MTAIQTRSHGGHSHSHHAHDNVYLTSTDKTDAGVRITRLGLYANVLMAVGKGVGGYIFHSQALLADAIHAATDLVSDVMTLATVSWSHEPPTRKFPSGYGKIESLGSLGVSALLLGGGLFMCGEACSSLCWHLLPDVAHFMHHWEIPFFSGHSHSHMAPSLNAAWLAAASVVIKEWLYRATMKVAKERKSTVLSSNAIHHRVDSLTGIVALAAIGGSYFLNGATWMDPVGSLIISLMVIRAGWGNTVNAFCECADIGVDDEMRLSVKKAADKALRNASMATAEDVEVRDIQGVKSGQNYLMDVELAVPSQWTLSRQRVVEQLVRERVGSNVRGVRRVRIRFVPKEQEQPDFADEFIGSEVSPHSPEPDEKHEHEHHHQHDHHEVQTNGKIKAP
ncbi:MAG: hypothetical protein M1834_000534 [Cirrosporium novae-zelandiae]|nr:MAG: hypothetical protein M1834_000534 [Cirrosporium novae-zelandiae]